MSDYVLAGRVAVVLGGGGGIGGACARALASAGARLAVVDRDGETAAKTAASLGGSAYRTDCGDEGALRDACGAIEAQLGDVDILINASAVFHSLIPAASFPMHKWDEVIRINQRGAFTACRVFGEAMVRRRSGAIVTIASVAGLRSFPLHAYAAAKAAVIAMSTNLAVEWGAFGIRVNTLSPGFTRTPAVAAAIARGETDEQPILAGTPLGRLVEPDEIAKAALFLVSPAASAITGIDLPVDCGWLAGASWQAYGGLTALRAADAART